jgi:4-diphosphocytidyl-2-C-methyl-D-erythritol kinase
MFALEREMKTALSAEERLRIASEVGSDLPLFLLGGCVLGIGRGEQVYPLAELPAIACVLVTPAIAVSTPQAFRDWDAMAESAQNDRKLTPPGTSATLGKFNRSAFEWLSKLANASSGAASPDVSGVPALSDGDRAENPLLDLVRAGIENDFERVVFPQYPELRDVKRALEREGCDYAALSGSGSTLFGLFRSAQRAQQAAERMSAEGLAATVTETLTRARFREQMFV